MGAWNTLFGYLVFIALDTALSHIVSKRYLAYMYDLPGYFLRQSGGEHTLFVLFIVGADADVIPAGSRPKACRDKLWPESSVFEPDNRRKELVLDCVNS